MRLMNLLNNSVSTVLFDLDGVLADSRQWHYDSFIQALNSLNFILDKETHDKHLDGLPTSKKLEWLVTHKNFNPHLIEEAKKLKQEITIDLINTYCKPDLNKINLLSYLQKNGIKLGVCTNAVKSTLDLILDKMQIEKFFDIKLSNSDITFPKPNSEIYLTAMKTLKVSPHQCVIVEDSQHGLEAARGSKAHVLHVMGPFDVNIKLIKRFLINLEKSYLVA